MLLKPDPMGEPRNPFQVFVLWITVFSGVALITPNPDSLITGVTEHFNNLQQTVWALLLFVGASLSLFGMYWPGSARDGLFMKRTGFTILTVSMFLFGTVLLFVYKYHLFFLAAILLGLAAASGIQAHRVNRHIKALIKYAGENHGAR